MAMPCRRGYLGHVGMRAGSVPLRRLENSRGEAIEFFGVVAAGAESLPVAQAGGSAVGCGLDVVGVADGGVAVWRAAGVVAQDEGGPESGWEEPRACVEGQEVAGVGAGENPGQEDLRGLGYSSAIPEPCARWGRIVLGWRGFRRIGRFAPVEEESSSQ